MFISRPVSSMLLVAVVLGAACARDPSTDLESVEAAADSWTTTTLASSIESAHPYANNVDLDQRIEGPADAIALKLKVHVAVEKDYDFVDVTSEDGTLIQQLTGTTDGWTREIPGHVARLHLRSDDSINDFGFSVTAIQAKTSAAPPPPSGQWTEFSASNVATPHPYRNSTDTTFTITAVPEATRVRVKFSGFDLETNYDFASILDATGAEVAKYTGQKGDFTSAEVSGNQLRIRFSSDNSVTKNGFTVSKYEALIPSASGGCQSNADCTNGTICQPVTCIRAPCPNICVAPQPGPTRGAAGDACDTVSAPCASGLACHTEQNSSLGGVCATAEWSRRPLASARATAHPYLDNTDQSFTVRGPAWATKLKVVFDGFDTEANYDFATVQAGSQQIGRYSGALGSVISAEVPGSSATVAFKSDQSVEGNGFEIHAVDVFGLPEQLVAVSIDPRQCGSDSFPTTSSGFSQHLRGLGVTVYGLHRYTFASVVCHACSCPTGERLVAIVAAEDATKVAALSRNSGIYSVQRGDNLYAGSLVELSTTPKQCGANAWDQYCSTIRNNACGGAIESRVRAWAGSLGVSVLALHTPEMREAVCSGCACPESFDLHLNVPSDKASIIEAQGFHR